MHMIFRCFRPTCGNFPPRLREVRTVDSYARCWKPIWSVICMHRKCYLCSGRSLAIVGCVS